MSTGRLTYTSFDALQGGAGGWQVKQEEALLAADRARALELVSTTFDLVDDVSRFPSVSEVMSLPRRLVLGTSGTGSSVLVHSAPAGPDASGRPGNVFNHVVVLPGLAAALLGDPPAPRPVELWRSPDWLVPWGPDAVRDAVLAPPPVPRRSAVVQRGAVAAFLSDARSPRSLGLGALLDAVDAALAGGPAVVMVIDDQDTGMLWLASAAMLASPEASARLTFSTWERAYALREARALPMVSLVPRADLALLVKVNAVVLDPSSQQPPTAAGWPSAAGGRVVCVTPWSTLARAVCSLARPDVLDRLTALDEISGLNPRAAACSPSWPLAVAVAEWQLPGRAQAADVLLRVPLEKIDDEQTLADVRDFRQGVLGITAFDAAEALTLMADRPDPEGVLLAEFAQTYVRRALAEPEFLSGPWPPGLPEMGPPASPDLPERVAGTLREDLPGLLLADLAPAEKAVRVLRALDLAELLGAGGQLSPADVAEAVRLAARMLLGPAGAQVLREAAPLCPATAARLVPELQDWVARSDQPPGSRLPEHLRPWLLDVLGTPPAGLPRDLWNEFVVLGLPDRAEYAPFRADGALALLTSPHFEAAQVPARARTTAALARCRGASPWSLKEVLRLQEGLAGRPDADLQDVVREVLDDAQPGTESAARLAAALLAETDVDKPLDEVTRHLAKVHALLTPGWHVADPRSSSTALADVVAHGVRYLSDETAVSEETAQRLRPHLLVAAVLTLARAEFGSFSSLAPGPRVRLAAVMPVLPGLGLGALAALPMLQEAMTEDATVAPGIFAAVVRAQLGAPMGSGPATDLWTAPLQPTAVQATGRHLLGEALLHVHLASHPHPLEWVRAQIDGLTGVIPADQFFELKTWAQALLRDTAVPTPDVAGGWTP